MATAATITVSTIRLVPLHFFFKKKKKNFFFFLFYYAAAARLLTKQASLAAVNLMVAPRLSFCATGAKAGNGPKMASRATKRIIYQGAES